MMQTIPAPPPPPPPPRKEQLPPLSRKHRCWSYTKTISRILL